MERNAAAALSNCRKLVWIAIGYVAVIAVVVYPAIHEEVGARVLVWNCIPPTLSLLVIATAFHKSRPRMISSMVFALLAAAVTTFFSVIWFFTPLDLDPHSGTTKLVFVFAPIVSLGLRALGSGVAWFVVRVT
jgi:hypothetical protein